MEYYKSIFGGELTVQTYGEVGAANDQMLEDNIMHARLTASDIVIMASDTPLASDKAAKVSLSLAGDDEVKLREVFDRLGEGGETPYPLKKEFWGDTFGSLVDKYGIDWMVNITATKD
jgi:PhnB protein